MRNSWEQNFQTKDGRQVALTCCWRSSETRAQRHTSGQRLTAKCPHEWKHWPGEHDSESRGPARTYSTVREISRKTGIPKSSVARIIRKDLQLKCFKRRRAQELTETNCTAGKLLLKVFPVCRGLLLLCRWKGVHCGCSSERKIIVKIS